MLCNYRRVEVSLKYIHAHTTRGIVDIKEFIFQFIQFFFLINIFLTWFSKLA